MMRSTDFGSKGMYKPTTSLAGGRASLENWINHIENTQSEEWKQQNEILKKANQPNLKLSGTTFDSNHLNKFLHDCPYAIIPNQATYLKKKLEKSRSRSKEEEEERNKSRCFRSIDRYTKGQMTVFIDQEKPDAPSPFLRIGVDTAKQISRQRKSLGMPQVKSVLAQYKTIIFDK